MKVSNMYPSKYLRASDLTGRAVKVTIRECVIEEIGGGVGEPEMKPVLFFAGKEKGLVLNRTNAGLVALTHGDETEVWTGKEIVIFPTKVPFGGKMVDAIRVKPPEPQAVAAGEDEEIPF